jgi:hypothetical protein
MQRRCLSCGQLWSGYDAYCPQCVSNKLVEEQNELIKRNQSINSSYEYESSRPYKRNRLGDVIANCVVFGFLIIPPVFFPESGLGKFLKIIWLIVSWPFMLVFEMIRN